jgi:phage virion morphogenesis protein
MAGTNISIEYDNKAVLARLGAIASNLASPRPLFLSIGEALLETTQKRFSTMTAPDGQAWQPLSPRYKKRKHMNADKILTLRGYLRSTLTYQVQDNEIKLGSNRKYAAAQQLGADINIAARSQQAYFNRTGDEVGNLFVKKSRSNFAQWVTIPGHTIHIPARPFLGISTEDEVLIIEKAKEFVSGDKTP